MKKAIKAIEDFQPRGEQEEVDKSLFLEIMKSNPRCLTRENLYGHFTVSAWVMNPSLDKVLCAFHNQYGRWAWLGGHCDGEEDFLKTAIQEIEEESGVKNLSSYGEGIFSLESLSVISHIKRGKYVPAHCHWNVTYAFIADEGCYIRIKEDENSAVGWLPFQDLIDATPNTTSSRDIYKKIIERVKEIEERKKA